MQERAYLHLYIYVWLVLIQGYFYRPMRIEDISWHLHDLLEGFLQLLSIMSVIRKDNVTLLVSSLPTTGPSLKQNGFQQKLQTRKFLDTFTVAIKAPYEATKRLSPVIEIGIHPSRFYPKS